jgi:anaerobic selenocysteine-containing dehydrogenase
MEDTMDEKFPRIELSRRTFLKMCGVFSSLATLGGGLSYSPTLRVASESDTGPTKEEKFSLCRMCHTYFCGAKVTLENGVATNIEGDKECQTNQGTFCIRGFGQILNLYDAYRVKAPMKRTNPQKGLDIDPGWVEISWDEAFGILEERMKRLRANPSDRRRLMVSTGFGADGCQTHRSFPVAFGTPNSIGATGAMCTTHFHNFLAHGTMMDRTDVEYCKMLIAAGRGTGANFGEAQGTVQPFMKARERGMKFIVVDPRCSPEASLANEWVPIRPGTDHAFFLGMQHVILHERGEFDIAFIKHRSNGAYLIGPDELYVTIDEKPAIWDLADGRAKAFDDETLVDPAIEGAFVVNGVRAMPAFELLKDMVATTSPEWAERITTVPAATIRRLANQFVELAHIGSTIELDGTSLPYRPVAINVNRGITNRKNGHLASYAAATTCMLVGAVDTPGSRLGTGFGPRVTVADEEGTLKLYEGEGLAPGPFPWQYPPRSYDAKDLYPHRHSSGFIALNALHKPEKYGLDYTLDTAIFFGHNFYTKGGTPEYITEALLKIPFIASIVIGIDETAMLSDLLLPEHAVLERTFVNINPPGSTEMRPKLVDHGNISLTGSILQTPVVPPIYNTMQADEIFLELADRAGCLTGVVETGPPSLNQLLNRPIRSDELKFDVTRRITIEDYLDRLLKNANGPDKGFEWFKQHHYNFQTAPASKSYNTAYNPKTRYNLYRILLKRSELNIRQNLAEAGVDMPGWDLEDFLSYYRPLTEYRPSDGWSAPADFDMWAIVWRTPPYMFDISAVQGNPLLYDISKNLDPFQFKVLLNRDTGAKKGIQDGDTIWIESPYGRCEAQVVLTETIHPEVVGFHGGLKRLSPQLNPITREGASFNTLVSISEGTFEPITAGLDTAPKVKIYKA